MLGFSHIDIAIKLYRYLTQKSEDIDLAIEFGDTIEYLSKYEHNPYYLYKTICNIWKSKSIVNV